MADPTSKGKKAFGSKNGKGNSNPAGRKSFSERQQERLKQEEAAARALAAERQRDSRRNAFLGDSTLGYSSNYARSGSQAAGRSQRGNAYGNTASSAKRNSYGSPAANARQNSYGSPTANARQNSYGNTAANTRRNSYGNTTAKHNAVKGNLATAGRKPYQFAKRPAKARPHTMDYTALFIILFLFVFGLIMIYSTSSYKASITYNNPMYFFKRQLIFGGIGVFLMVGMSRLDYHLFHKADIIPIIIYAGTIILNLLTFVIGTDVNGSKRWLRFGPLSLQPSEVAKLAMIMILAHYLSENEADLKNFMGIVRACVISLPMVILIGIENLSTCIILMGITAVMIFVTSPVYKPFALIGGFALAGVSILLKAESYRMDRITTWLDPLSTDQGMQTMQGLYAIGSGGIFGKGLGQSMQKMGFIPEPHNDMIFSVVCEELGLFGAIGIILLFAILLIRFYRIAIRANDLYGSLIVIGAIAHIGLQMFVNIGVVTNTIPNTGVPLPFISYGGSSLFFLFIEMGLVLSVSKYAKIPAKKDNG